jgi:hypothetical protein
VAEHLADGARAGRVPAAARRAPGLLEIVFPMLEVLRDSFDPPALHNLESSRRRQRQPGSAPARPGVARPHRAASNLLALSNLCHQVLARHPEYLTAARGIHLHEGRVCGRNETELEERLRSAPPGEEGERAAPIPPAEMV